MSGATEGDEAEAFARLLRGLKERSGLSYGTLAGRLHLSTSTLHRYCTGAAVPADYAPVERLARICRATSEELVELHRHWVLADAARVRRTERTDRSAPRPPDPGETGAVGSGARARPGDGTGGGDGDGEHPGDRGAGEGADGDDDDCPVVVHGSSGDGTSRRAAGAAEATGATGVSVPRARRRTALIAAASVAAVAVLGAAALALRPDPGAGDPAGAGRAPGATVTAPGGGRGGGAASGEPSRAPSPSGTRDEPSASAPGSPSAGGADPGGRGGAGPEDDTGALPLAVGVRPYVYDSPCSQHFLVDSDPERVGPPATEQDAARWAAAYRAVSSGEQRVALTVQGTGRQTVVLEALHVRVITKGAPLAWNDYAMGVGCGGGVGTASFTVDLDAGSPVVGVEHGARDFPYKVSESDPEVFYVTARTTAHDVRWELALDWSSGTRRGTVRIDSGDGPFRTSADVHRPGWDYPLGGTEWIAREEQRSGRRSRRAGRTAGPDGRPTRRRADRS
ncbi:helix-turn-helix domain-containing protein [Streptomyces sp. ACT015]|uniref:helix-turn-helix domain-containing protein n=1 Tax=Streptomyces sp. ACT015 TaxID=3134807 RepID=UPI003D17A621